MAEHREKPRAIAILRCENGELRVDMEAFASILRQREIGDRPISIVSISGAFRKGKSFMMNFFIRYLRNKGYKNRIWMGKEDEPFKGGFEWKGGRNRCTNGILVWNEAFIVNSGGKEIAIILMDTQGLFEIGTTGTTDSLIFALSTLISSVQIYNLSQQIQESDLGFLQFYTSCAEAARECGDTEDKPLQTLVFLVRDWPHASELEYGSSKGAKYLDEVLRRDFATKEASSVRKHLRSSFQDIKCCLMPYPGEKVATTTEFRGCPRDIAGEFLRVTSEFVESLLHPDNLVVKKINGQVMTAPAILQYADSCRERLETRELPDPMEMMKNVAEVQNFEAQRQCFEEYCRILNEVLVDSFTDEILLCDMHENAFRGVLKKFEEMTRFGTSDLRRRHQEYLKDKIKREYTMREQLNRSKKLQEETELLRMIERISQTYENNMRKETRRILSDHELEQMHNKFAAVAADTYFAGKSSHLKDQYYTALQEKLLRIQLDVQSESTERRTIEAENDVKEQEMLRLELQCRIQYRGEMIKLIENYVDEVKLRHSEYVHRRHALDHFKMSATASSQTFQKHLNSLRQKLDEEFNKIKQTNAEKKVLLEMALQAERNNAYSRYDRAFREILKDNYMKEGELLEIHRMVVKDLMTDLRHPTVSAAADNPLIAEHLHKAGSKLDGKYAIVKEWNKKNNTMLRKCFRVAKKVAATLAVLACRVATVVLLV